jgi:chemotaxis protein methyltransferase CheR
VEISNNLFPQFKAIPFSGAVLYRKTGGAEKTEGPDSAISMAERSVSMPDPLPNALCMPAPAPAQPENVQHAESHPVSHEAFDALCRIAHSYADLGELTEAIKWCEKAITANKLKPAAHYLLATIHQELGQSETAMQSLMRTLYLDPDFVLAHFALGNLCLSQGRRREAERHFDNALSLLTPHSQDELLPESDGLTAGRLTEIITSARSGLSRLTPET